MLNTIRLNSTTSNSNTSQPWKLEYDSILQQYYYINLLDNSISFDSPCEVMNHKKSSSTNKKLFASFKKQREYNQHHKNCPLSRSSSNNTTTTATNSNSTTKSKSIYRRLSDALSLKSTKSNESTPNNSPRNSIVSNVSNASSESSTTMVDSITLMDVGNLDDEYLLNNNRLNNFKNFTGTSQGNLRFGYISDNYHEDAISISSDESSVLNDPLTSDEDEDEVRVFNQNYIYNPNYDGAFFDYEDDDCKDNEMIDIEKENERRELRLQILKELY